MALLFTKDLARYPKAAVFRLNEGSVKHHPLSRIGALALKAFNHGIICREWIRNCRTCPA